MEVPCFTHAMQRMRILNWGTGTALAQARVYSQVFRRPDFPEQGFKGKIGQDMADDFVKGRGGKEHG